MSIIDDIEHAVGFVEATIDEAAARIATIGDWGTAGPAADEHPVTTIATTAPTFVDGWWSEARRVDAHPGRIGPPITPCCAVDHTTDMHPDDWDALLNALRTRAGDGACMHFLIGRDEAHGIVQLVPITRNGNHAGGPAPHGIYIDGAGNHFHPNVLAVGIEFHCAGGQVRLVNNEWRFVEDGKMHGAAISAREIEADQARPGRGWHLLSAYQQDVRARLHAALDAAMRPMPDGLRAASTGEAVPSWGVPRSTRFVGHVSLDPTHRSDPWPPGMRTLR